MRKMILAGLLMVSGSAFANMDGMPDVNGDTQRMIHYAGLAVQDHAVKVVGMEPGSVKVAYNYSNGLFTATDTHQGCSFQAQTKMSMRRLSTGHYWRVIEVGTNTCDNPVTPN
ncbi:MAG: hypothetical protein ACKOX6_15255 [Bdellovibrio sp.]